jgi:hypothetical protein
MFVLSFPWIQEQCNQAPVSKKKTKIKEKMHINTFIYHILLLLLFLLKFVFNFAIDMIYKCIWNGYIIKNNKKKIDN